MAVLPNPWSSTPRFRCKSWKKLFELRMCTCILCPNCKNYTSLHSLPLPRACTSLCSLPLPRACKEPVFSPLTWGWWSPSPQLSVCSQLHSLLPQPPVLVCHSTQTTNPSTASHYSPVDYLHSHPTTKVTYCLAFKENLCVPCNNNHTNRTPY